MLQKLGIGVVLLLLITSDSSSSKIWRPRWLIANEMKVFGFAISHNSLGEYGLLFIL